MSGAYVLIYTCGCRDRVARPVEDVTEVLSTAVCRPSDCHSCTEAEPCETRRSMPPAYTSYPFQEIKPQHTRLKR